MKRNEIVLLQLIWIEAMKIIKSSALAKISIFGANVLLAMAISFPATAQTTPKELSFDAATVKPAAPLDMAKLAADVRAGVMPKLGPQVYGSRANYIFMTLQDLMAIAFEVKPYQIRGPEWIKTEHFDIEATIPEGSTTKDAPAMLQTLLKERFKLTTHSQEQEQPVMALIVGSNGPKLKPSPVVANAEDKTADDTSGQNPPRVKMTTNSDGSTSINMGSKGTITQRMDLATQTFHLESTSVNMSGLADILTRIMSAGGGGQQVIDKTDLKGNYQIALDIPIGDIARIAASTSGVAPGQIRGGTDASNSPAATASEPQGGSSLFRSIQDLGLKLERRKAPVQQLIIDHIEKTPTAN